MNDSYPQGLHEMLRRPNLVRYVSLIYLVMRKDTCVDRLSLRTNAAGDVVGEVQVMNAGQRVAQWIPPPGCDARGAVDQLRASFDFRKKADHSEQATWNITCGDCTAKLRLWLTGDKGNADTQVFVDEGLDAGQAERVLDVWFPDQIVNAFLRDKPIT
jgi:hypothetical protein